MTTDMGATLLLRPLLSVIRCIQEGVYVHDLSVGPAYLSFHAFLVLIQVLLVIFQDVLIINQGFLILFHDLLVTFKDADCFLEAFDSFFLVAI